jgi:hypothetical protein
MARIKDNLIVKGARGNLGKQVVFKKHGKDTVMAKMPVVSKKRPTKDQEKRRELFSEAVTYASSALKDPMLKKAYEEKAGPERRAYNLALSDYLNAPVVEQIDTSKYDGSLGSIITITATDDFRVAEVSVRIFNSSGTLLEQDDAIPHRIDSTKWIYKARAVNKKLSGTKIKVVAKDIPGNAGEGQQKIE